MTENRAGRIVVGFDGSEPAARALESGVRLARRTRARVDVVTSWRWPVNWSAAPVATAWSPMDDADEIRRAATRLLERFAQDGVDTSARVVEGNAAEALTAAAEGAALLVVGSRGRGGFRGLLLGSVSTACVQHARCPVLIHRGDTTLDDRRRSVVVGIDGSAESGEALRTAVALARQLGHTVRTITTWTWPSVLNRTEPPFEHWSPEADARAAASSALDIAADLFDDDVRVTSEMVEGSPAEVLIEASRDAAFLALGSRGLGGFRGQLLGSVGQECAQHADCPVLIHRS